MRKLSIEDTFACSEVLRVSYDDFWTILGLIEKDISYHQVPGEKAFVEPKARLTVTFLETGETFRSLAFQFRILNAAISCSIMEVCCVITKIMQYLKTLSKADDWEAIARIFNER